ncbi:MAG: N-acetylmuramoyl-L-alanine amidase [Verrucomicrobia bacterium]|nr:N-acetylmuramoyl-L-alanine amidase [Verrucomicrobiota bacterium]
MSRVVFLFLLLVGAGFANENWEVARIGRVDYVTLESFRKFYGLKGPAVVDPEKSFDLTSPQGSMNLKVDSREMRWKGARYWLSHAVRQSEGITLIPRVDLVKTFDPLLRPNVEIAKRPVLGVVVDPGHGGGDYGTRAARGLSEKVANTDVSKRLVRMLEGAGIPTVLTRTKDRYVDHGVRAALADDRPGYIFVSIHFNEDSSRETTGWETFCLSPQHAPSTSSGGTLRGDERQAWPGNEFDHHNFLLTQAIHRAAVLAKSNAPSDRGLKRARFKVLRLARAPAVLVEGGFMSNPREAALLKTESYREQVARWVFEGILAYRRSQESPEGSARLEVATAGSAGTNPPATTLEAVPGFRASSNPPVAVRPGIDPAKRPAASKELEVRKAVAVEPEVRKALPVEPRKGE